MQHADIILVLHLHEKKKIDVLTTTLTSCH